MSSSRPSRTRSSHTFRRGDFEYKNPKHDDGWHVRGEWGVAGTDGVDVERIANGMTSALDGFGSGSSKLPGIFGLVGGVIEGLAALGNGRQIEDGPDDDKKGDKNEDKKERKPQHRYASSDDDRKRKRRSTYDTGRGEEGRTRRRDRRQRSSSARQYTDGYFFDRDGYDGQETRKRRRSWAS